MNKSFRQIFEARSVAVFAASDSLAAVMHDGLRGQLRELLIAEFFSPLLPPILGVGHGEIVDSAGGTSSEQDIVIYDRGLTPPALVGNSGIFPVDTVLYSFEIKSRLTLPELRKSEENARRLLDLKLMRGRQASRFIIPGLIAFDTDLSPQGKTELQRYTEFAASEHPDGIFGLRMLCVAKRGYWYLGENDGVGSVWMEGELSQQRCPGLELLDVLSSIINGCEMQREGRVTDLNSYLIETNVNVCGHAGLDPNAPRPLPNLGPVEHRHESRGPSGPIGPSR